MHYQQDACFTPKAGGHMYRSYTVDPNGHAVPVMNAWSLANETCASWDAHQDAIIDCYQFGLEDEETDEETEVLPRLSIFDNRDTCFMSDCQKGLRQSQENKFPDAGFAACEKHFHADLVTVLGHKHSVDFYGLSRCTREDEFQLLWAMLDPVAKAYLEKYPKSLWTKLYGHAAKGHRVTSSVTRQATMLYLLH